MQNQLHSSVLRLALFTEICMVEHCRIDINVILGYDTLLLNKRGLHRLI